MTAFIRKILKNLFGQKTAEEVLSGYVARNTIWLFAMHLAALVIGFFANFLYIRIAGIEAYGAFVYTFNLLYIGGTIAVFGTDNFLIRKVAAYRETADWAHLKGTFLFAIRAVIIAVAILAFPVGATLAVTAEIRQLTLGQWVLISGCALLLLAVISIGQSGLQGMKKPAWSQLTEKLIRPLAGVLLLLMYALISGKPDIGDLIWLNLVTLAIVASSGFLLLQKSGLFKPTKQPARIDGKTWTRMLSAFFVIDMLYILNARIDVFVLGIYRSHAEIAVYNVALRFSEIIGFGLIIINFILAPLVASLFARNDPGGLQRMVTRSARAVTIVSVPVALIILLLRHPLLAFFDANVFDGDMALVILCCGQLVNVACGSVGVLLMMTGNQRSSIISLLCGTIVGIALNVMLAPGMGLTGTALATAASVVTWNLLMYYFVRKKLRIRTTAFGNF